MKNRILKEEMCPIVKSMNRVETVHIKIMMMALVNSGLLETEIYNKALVIYKKEIEQSISIDEWLGLLEFGKFTITKTRYDEGEFEEFNIYSAKNNIDFVDEFGYSNAQWLIDNAEYVEKHTSKKETI